MRARLRYSLLSPRAPRRGAGLVVGLVLAAVLCVGAVLAGMIADVATHAYAAGIVALAGAL